MCWTFAPPFKKKLNIVMFMVRMVTTIEKACICRLF
jgi:hypothetical protein